MRDLIERLDAVLRSKPAPTTIPDADPKEVPATQMTISVEEHREEAPAFKRTYSGLISRGIKVSVYFKTSSYSNTQSGGELTQPDGKWILFDPDRIADKIIDPVLLPEVQHFVSACKKADYEFRRLPPSRFVDEKGVAWVRESALLRAEVARLTQALAGARKKALEEAARELSMRRLALDGQTEVIAIAREMAVYSICIEAIRALQEPAHE